MRAWRRWLTRAERFLEEKLLPLVPPIRTNGVLSALNAAKSDVPPAIPAAFLVLFRRFMSSSANENRSAGRLNTPDWPAYYRAVAGAPPRRSLLAALERFARDDRQMAPGLAVDLGCGGGTDTIELLRRGWRVLAIDAEPHAIEFLRHRSDLHNSEQLETQVSRLEQATWPTADLINASAVLPFLTPDSLDDVWVRIVRSLRASGRFAGHFFGNRDAWATLPGRSHHTREQVESLFSSFEIEYLDEREYDGETALGAPKHWHIFEIAALKRG